jgi:hypothetical protein
MGAGRESLWRHSYSHSRPHHIEEAGRWRSAVENIVRVGENTRIWRHVRVAREGS